MFPLRFSNSANLHQIRFFSRDPFPNKLQHYLHRAKLIDSIRLTLRSKPTTATLTSLLNNRLLDSFVVKNALRSSPSISSAWFIFKTLKKNKTPHFSFETETLHAFATVLAKFHRSSELNSLIGVINAGKFGNVRFSFMNLINLYLTANDFDSVLNTWHEYRSCRESSRCCNTESYNIVMQVYVSLGRNFEAVEIFDLLINEGKIPNSRTFTIMIEHVVKLRNLDSALEIFKILPSMRITRTMKHYSVLIEAFVEAERFEEVKFLLDEMKEDGKFPSRRMFTPLKRMKEAGFRQETEDFLKEMLPNERIKNVYIDSEEEEDEEDDLKLKLKPWMDPKALADCLKQWRSDSVAVLEEAGFVWTNLLVCKMLRSFKSFETAWSFFCWVAIQPGFTHDAYTIERMMAILARNGQVELLDKLISKVRIEGIELPFSTIRLIIDLYGLSKKPDAAIAVFREFSGSGSISGFNLMILYSALLRTLTKCKRNEEALETLEEMISNGVSPDIQTFSGLMYHFAFQGEIQIVQRLFTTVKRIGLEPDPYMLKVLVEAYCKCERAVLAFRVFQDLKDFGLLLDGETKDLLVKSLWREEKRKEAAAVEESYEEEEGEKKKKNSVLRLVLKGHVWSISSSDIDRVYSLYRDCVLRSSS